MAEMKRNLIFKWNSINSFVCSLFQICVYICFFLSSFQIFFFLLYSLHFSICPLPLCAPARSTFIVRNSFARWLFFDKIMCDVIIFLNCCILFLSDWHGHREMCGCVRVLKRTRTRTPMRWCHIQQREICHLISQLN